MPHRRQMKLGVSMIGLGYHVAAWRHPDVPADGSPNIAHSVAVAQTAERGKLDMVFLADAVGIREYDEPPGALCRFSNSSRFEPITLLAALSMATQRIGLVATLSTTYSEPFHVARQFASLDHLSGGRAGWNVVTSVTPMEAQNFNYETTPDYDKRYARAAEFVEVVRGLWDCWEDDAFVRDKASGVFFDPAKMHVLNHKGEHFSVRGPINIPRTPQGYPVIVQAGASEQGQEMAASTADVVFCAAASLENAQKYYASVKGRMAKFGRSPDTLHIMPGIMAVVGRTEQEAQDKYGALQDLIDPKVGLAQLAASLGDLSGYDLDGPVPEDKINPRMRSRAALMLDMARRGNLTIRQLYLAVAAGNGHNVAVGSAKQVADTMQEWFESEAADGFNYVPAALPGGINDFVDLVVPELQRRGLFRTEYEGATLRDNLGLPIPANRHTMARAVDKTGDGMTVEMAMTRAAHSAVIPAKAGIQSGHEFAVYWVPLSRDDSCWCVALDLPRGAAFHDNARRGAGRLPLAQRAADRELPAGRRRRRGGAAVRRQDGPILGQPVVVENRGGAAGLIAGRAVAARRRTATPCWSPPTRWWSRN